MPSESLLGLPDNNGIVGAQRVCFLPYGEIQTLRSMRMAPEASLRF